MAPLLASWSSRRQSLTPSAWGARQAASTQASFKPSTTLLLLF
jgi:hypothetical protein